MYSLHLPNQTNFSKILMVILHRVYKAEQHVVVAPEACRICDTKQPQEWVVQ